MAENPFEIPQAMRDVVEQNVKQAHAAYEQLNDFMTKAMGAWTGAMPANPLASGFKDVQDRIMAFAKENGESAFTFAEKISHAQTFQELSAHQTQFAQERMQVFMAQTQELYKLIGETIQKSGHS
jgi:hypothetical protein